MIFIESDIYPYTLFNELNEAWITPLITFFFHTLRYTPAGLCPMRVHVIYRSGAYTIEEGIPVSPARTLITQTTHIPAHYLKNQTWYPACQVNNTYLNPEHRVTGMRVFFRQADNPWPHLWAITYAVPGYAVALIALTMDAW